MPLNRSWTSQYIRDMGSLVYVHSFIASSASVLFLKSARVSLTRLFLRARSLPPTSARLPIPMQRVLAATFRLSRGAVTSSSVLSPASIPTLNLRSQPAISRLHSKMSYTTEPRGAPNSLDYRLFFRSPNGTVISPFHDIPLYANTEKTVCNMVVEVPRWTNAKMEIDTKSKMNPIKQDIKKGKLRYVHNCFPHHGYIWNYGALPQTWEDPNHTDSDTNCKGDNDPIDACEIGFKIHPQGAVVQVKILGVMALIDEGETDWKVICIDVNDPLAADLNDIADVEKQMPGFLTATHEWFRIYKIPSGKPENQFAFNGEAKDKEFAHAVIAKTHKQWEQLLSKATENPGLACENVNVMSSPYQIGAEDALAIIDQAPAKADPEPVDDEVDKWHYVKL